MSIFNAVAAGSRYIDTSRKIIGSYNIISDYFSQYVSLNQDVPGLGSRGVKYRRFRSIVSRSSVFLSSVPESHHLNHPLSAQT